MASGGGRSPSVPGEAVSLPERILLVPEKLVFDCRSGGRVILTPSVIMVMQGYRQLDAPEQRRPTATKQQLRLAGVR